MLGRATLLTKNFSIACAAINSRGSVHPPSVTFSIACAAMNGVDLIKYEITIFSIACAAMNSSEPA